MPIGLRGDRSDEDLDMHCDRGPNTIKALIGREPGVQMAAVSLKTGEVRVLYDPEAASEDCLVAAIQKPGYRVVGRH